MWDVFKSLFSGPSSFAASSSNGNSSFGTTFYESDSDLFADSSSSFAHESSINPATGLMMMGCTDTGGNIYGCSSFDSFSSSSMFDSSSSFDSFSSSTGSSLWD
jgi:hypothetical protein